VAIGRRRARSNRLSTTPNSRAHTVVAPAISTIGGRASGAPSIITEPMPNAAAPPSTKAPKEGTNASAVINPRPSSASATPA
jgi:hypothetical protein